MRAANIRNLGIKELRSLYRDRILCFFVVYAVTASIYVIAKSAPETLNNAPIGVVDLDQSQLSTRIVDAFFPPRFALPVQTTAGVMDARLDQGVDIFALNIPPDFQRDVLAKRRQVSMAEVAAHPVIAHNDPSPARERVLRLFEEQQIPLNMVIALPSLDGIKRAVELDLGVALLPRRCAVTEIASKRLVAVPVNGVSRKREVTLVCRKAHRSHAADAFLKVAQTI